MDAALFIREFKAQPTTKAKYLAHLQHMTAAGISADTVTPQQFNDYLEAKGTGNSDCRQALAALWAYQKWAGLEPLDFEIPKEVGPATPPLTPDQLEQLLAACYQTRYTTYVDRNRALILTAWDTMIRSSEIGRVRTVDMDLGSRTLRVLTKAKAKQPRHVEEKIFSPRTARAIEIWLEIRPTFPTAHAPYLFLSRPQTVKGRPVKDPGRVTRDGFQSMLRRVSSKCGFHCHPHQLRAGGATAAIERGVPDRLVMQAGGWKTHSVFERYTERVKLSAYADQMWGES